MPDTSQLPSFILTAVGVRRIFHYFGLIEAFHMDPHKLHAFLGEPLCLPPAAPACGGPRIFRQPR